MAADGTNSKPLTRLTATGLDNFDNPLAWSRDGSQIAYTTIRALDGSDAIDPNNVGNLWVVKADGSTARAVTLVTASSNASCDGAQWRPY